MPWSVRAAAAALALVLLVLGGLLAFLARQHQAPWLHGLVVMGAAALLLTGLLRGWRLAWLWGRFLGLFLALLVALPAWSAWRGGGVPAALLAVPLLGLAAPLLVMSLALLRPSTPAWFGLVCPACGGVGATPADLRFHLARCRRCRAVW
jgi:hypothetical protein